MKRNGKELQKADLRKKLMRDFNMYDGAYKRNGGLVFHAEKSTVHDKARSFSMTKSPKHLAGQKSGQNSGPNGMLEPTRPLNGPLVSSL